MKRLNWLTEDKAVWPKEIKVELVEKEGQFSYSFQVDGEEAMLYPCCEYLFVEAKTQYLMDHGVEIEYIEDWDMFNFNVPEALNGIEY